MTSVGWLDGATEEALRSALRTVAPELASLPLRMKLRPPSLNPLWWSSSAVVDGSFVVKFAWSEARAVRLWREGVVLDRLRRMDPSLPVPDVVALSKRPALVVTRMVTGVPLGGEWAWSLAGPDAEQVGHQLGTFLARIHDLDVVDVLGDLPVVQPTPQADTERLRRRFPRLVDQRRAASVLQWCDWVDDVLGEDAGVPPRVFVHGDLHGYNQVWDQREPSLIAVVDFEECGHFDAHFDFRYLPGGARKLDLLLATMAGYEQASGRRLAVDRVMAWNVRTVLGDALWRTEAGVALPGGGTATTWVDDLAGRLSALGLC